MSALSVVPYQKLGFLYKLQLAAWKLRTINKWLSYYFYQLLEKSLSGNLEALNRICVQF